LCLYCISNPINIYKGGAAEIFKDLKMIMIIGQFKGMIMLIEDLKNWDRYNSYCRGVVNGSGPGCPPYLE